MQRGFISIGDIRQWRGVALAVVLAFLTCTDSMARGAGGVAHGGEVQLVRLAVARFHK